MRPYGQLTIVIGKLEDPVLRTAPVRELGESEYVACFMTFYGELYKLLVVVDKL